MRCGAGTYVRSLARDLAVALGTVGHVAALRRTESSGFSVEQAVRFDDLEAIAGRGELEGRLIRGAACLTRLPRLVLDDAAAAAIACGRSIEIPPDPPLSPTKITPFEKGGGGDLSSRGGGDFRAALLSPSGELLAIGRAEGGRLVPERGFPR